MGPLEMLRERWEMQVRLCSSPVALLVLNVLKLLPVCPVLQAPRIQVTHEVAQCSWGSIAYLSSLISLRQQPQKTICNFLLPNPSPNIWHMLFLFSF